MTTTTRAHQADDGTYSTAVFSDCGLYRYRLMRHWADAPTLAYIMLNPSKADEKANDPTIARCEKRARLLGYGGIDIVNLFAFRATDPADLKRAASPEGPENSAHLCAAAKGAGLRLAAWGVHGTHRDQDKVAMGWLKGLDLHVLGLTRHGLPRHPLYVSYAARPVLWTPFQAESGESRNA